MYKLSRFIEIEYRELRKFNEKLCTLYVQIVWICKESEFCGYIECTGLRQSNGKLYTFDV